MAYSSFRVSTKDMDNYYLPLKENFDTIIESINNNGYGQIIYDYNGPGDFTVNSYNVWESRSQSMVIIDRNGITYSESDAGPNLWGVTSEEGINFLQGTVDIKGLAKLKYCNNCNDANGLPYSTIKSFSDRFGYLKDLKENYGVTEGYIFYDYSLPINQRWYPSVYDSVGRSYVFKNYLGTNKSEIALAAETSIPVQDITSSIESSVPIKPEINTSSVIVNCCDGKTTYIIDGVYDVGTVLYSKDVLPVPCYQVIENTSEGADNFFYWNEFGKGGKCIDCTTTYGSCKGGSGSSGGGR